MWRDSLKENRDLKNLQALRSNPVEEKVWVNDVLKDVDYCQNPYTSLNQHIISHKDAKVAP